MVEELKSPTQSSSRAYQHILQEAKSRTGLGDDSGVEDSDCSEWRDCVCVLLVGGAGVAVLGEAEGEPREGSWSLVISPSNCSVTLVICMELVLTRGHIPAQFAHDNTACVHGNELQLRITRLL